MDLSLPHGTGAAELLKACPNATLKVHPNMVAPLTDPSGVLRAAGRTLYGDTFEPVFGTVLPVDRERVVAVSAGDTIGEGESHQILHLPESMALLDTQHGSAFVGNVLGAVFPSLTGRTGVRLGIPIPTTSRLCPDLAVASVDQIARHEGIKRAFTTHYGMVSDVEASGEMMRRAIRVFESIAVQSLRMHMRGQMLRKFCFERITDHVKSEAEKGDFAWSEEADSLLEIEIGLNTEATAQLVEWALEQGLPHLGNDTEFHSEFEGGRLRAEKLSAQHLEMLVRSWNHTEHLSWTEELTAAEASANTRPTAH